MNAKHRILTIGILLGTAGIGKSTIIGFGQLGGSNATVPAGLGSNATADSSGYVVANGVTPNIALIWDAAWDIHTSVQFANLENKTVGGSAWDNEGSIPRVGQLDTGFHTIDFLADDGFALVLNSFDFCQTPQTAGTTVWDVTLTDSASNVVWSSPGLTLTNNVVTISPNFTGALGEDYRLTFRLVSETYGSSGRHAIDNLSFNQVPLPPPPVSLTWTGAINAQWNTSSPNWNAGGPVLWNSGNVQEAIFGTTGPKAILMPEPITARSLLFTAPGYTVSGTGPLTLVETSVLAAEASAAISVPVTGLAGWKKSGAGTLTLTGDQSVSGPGLLNEGAVHYIGDASSNGNGNLRLADGLGLRASLRMDSTGTLDFSGSVRLAPGDGSAASIHQSDGTVNVGGPGVEYLEIGGGVATASGSYGAYHLNGGTLNTGGGGSVSGMRIGNEGLGAFVQTGGLLNSARWLAIGGFGGLKGEGVATFLGGEATVAPGYRFLIGDRADSSGTLNLGSLAGGSANVTTLNPTGLAVGSAGGATRAVLNLNQGTLVLGGPIHQATGTVQTAVNFNGATLRAGADSISLMSPSVASGSIHRGGLTVDTAGFNVVLETSLLAAEGSGIYPAGGGFTLAAGGSGYLGAPLVSIVNDGPGSGATAIAEVVSGSVTRILMTSPGRNYAVGESLNFVFSGGGATVPLTSYTHVLTNSDLKTNSLGGLVKTGDGKLTLIGTLSYSGDTRVEGGTLTTDGPMNGTTVRVLPGAQLEGGLNTGSPVIVEGTLAPGNGIGLAVGMSSLAFAPGSTLALEMTDWNGGAGLGYDSINSGSLAISATPGSPLTILLETSLLVNFSETARQFVLASVSGSVTGLTADNWRVNVPGFSGTGSWRLTASGSQLLLGYTPAGGGYNAWLAGFPGLTDSAPLADPDGDRIQNLMEYILGGDPRVSSTAVLPEASVSQGSLVFRFERGSATTADTTQVFQYSSTLGAWTDVALPQSTSGNVTIQPNLPSAGRETVTITLPPAAAEGGKIFGRLSAARK